MQSFAVRGLWLVVTGFVVLAGGCTKPEPIADIQDKPVEQTQSERLQSYYPDLASGRFAVVADFEEPSHAELFQVRESDAVVARPSVLAGEGVKGTGGNCLSVVLGKAGRELVASNAEGRNWVLKRRWSLYNLLLMHVYSPVDSLGFEVTLVSGRGEERRVAQTSLALGKGWNLLRLGLSEVGGRISLEDVREIRLSVPDRSEPVALRLDDVILVDSHRVLYGEPGNEDGKLYAEMDGRQLVGGAGGRFELRFSEGQIVNWYCLERDKSRLNDLVGEDVTMGPLPVVLDGGAKEAVASPLAGFSGLGEVVTASQRLVEASSVRLVVECSWDFRQSVTDRSDGEADVTWRYCIYPWGGVYVEMGCVTQRGHFSPKQVGLVMSRQADMGAEVVVHGEGAILRNDGARGIGYARVGGLEEPGLLWSFPGEAGIGEMGAIRDSDGSAVSLVAVAGEPTRPHQKWNCFLKVWPAVVCGVDGCEGLVLSAYDGVESELLVGELAGEGSGDADGDGFSERDGTLVLSPEMNRVQVRVRSGGEGRLPVALSVEGSAGMNPWVYVDYKIRREIERDAKGDVLVAVPDKNGGECTVEVYLEGDASIDKGRE